MGISQPDPVIVSAERLPFREMGGDTRIFVVMSDGECLDVVTYYSDEHFWNPDDFIGMTVRDAREMIHREYVNYFRC